MKTLKYVLWGVILCSLVFSSFSIYPSRKTFIQPGTVIFYETYTQQEVLSKLDQDDQLFNWLRKEDTDPESSRIGRCHQDNLEDLRNYILSEAFQTKVQEDLSVVPGAEAKDQMISLYAIRKSASKDIFPLQEDIKEVSISKNESEDDYALLITFSESGAEKWAVMTRLNKGRDIAMLYKGKVISAPRVREEIKGGLCSISGKFTASEIQQLKSVFEN